MRKFREHAIAIFAIARAGAQLHQLVMLEREPQFLDDAWIQAALPDQYDGVQVMAQASQVLFLPFTERHGRIIG